ncbi:zinc ribbon domain-containing protein [Conexibacter stalactiti]|uniref:Zinc ribbon domain-containing protein n=1 Tax=Conexibacter stalactiti TaxID=1940611 RepID=A0ABU4HZZ6_9ACTN|nr:zinc ribbon domain-containing protein [Conexibacter stalactiti]MDW5598883.1 zinc ribbon domain-containing protein [Conexibacter stalactiti]MEC5039525.1 zinc ribbon domain-containing protein [Conexibacter stalactiti]
MPIYEFACRGCGPFDVQRPMARAAEPADCPGCGTPAARIFSAPASRAPIAAGVRAGLAAEERSRDAPQRVNGSQIGHGHAGHNHRHTHGTSGGRPWQLSH